MLPMPSKGMRARGIRAVTYTGMASVIHQTAIQTARAAVARAAPSRATVSPLAARYPSGSHQATSRASAGPANSPMRDSRRVSPASGDGAEEDGDEAVWVMRIPAVDCVKLIHARRFLNRRSGIHAHPGRAQGPIAARTSYLVGNAGPAAGMLRCPHGRD